MKSNRPNYPNFGFGTGLSRLLQDAFEGVDDLGIFPKPSGTNELSLKADLYENENHYLVSAELPGVSKQDVSVEFAEGVLTIRATISRETTDGRKNFPLKRSISLPDLVGDGELTAKLENGILAITLPKAEAAKPRSITIE